MIYTTGGKKRKNMHCLKINNWIISNYTLLLNILNEDDLWFECCIFVRKTSKRFKYCRLKSMIFARSFDLMLFFDGWKLKLIFKIKFIWVWVNFVWMLNSKYLLKGSNIKCINYYTFICKTTILISRIKYRGIVHCVRNVKYALCVSNPHYNLHLIFNLQAYVFHTFCEYNIGKIHK